MNQRELNDTRLVWHCRNRYTDKCRLHISCKGSSCHDYSARPYSWHSLKENDPIKGYIKESR